MSSILNDIDVGYREVGPPEAGEEHNVTETTFDENCVICAPEGSRITELSTGREFVADGHGHLYFEGATFCSPRDLELPVRLESP
jgi:hypothetical protein